MTKPASILVVDDDFFAREALRIALCQNYLVTLTASEEEAEKVLKNQDFDLILLDLCLVTTDGLTLFKKWKPRYPNTPFVFCSGESSIEKAVSCLRKGASDYVVKPFQKEDLLLILERVLNLKALQKKEESLNTLTSPFPVQFIGKSPKALELLNKINRLKTQTHLNVFILGESGTGKELVAKLLHQQEPSSQRPFVVVNAPAVPHHLMEAELFGVEKGAYTDAKQSRAGKFEMADGGDLFLDEIGDLPFDTQPKLLRAIQEKQIERVGSHKTKKIEVRMISATNQSLSTLVKNQKFREDLIYRLSDVVLALPPLRERKEDIPELLTHFLQKYKATHISVSQNAIDQLLQYHWPGNIRQLESTIKRTLVFSDQKQITQFEIYDLHASDPLSQPTEKISFEANKADTLSYETIAAALQRNNGNKKAVCNELGISRATFYRKLNQIKDKA